MIAAVSSVGQADAVLLQDLGAALRVEVLVRREVAVGAYPAGGRTV